MTALRAENVNYLWSQLLFEEWSRLGVRHVVICPGSRSSPLAIAAVRHPHLRSVVVIDERCAGFIALGVAKASGAPAVVLTTSGTAVANLLPAMVEAWMTSTPILAVTADRPPELRDCGANQSIDQRTIFGTFARWSFELPVPSVDVDAGFVVSTANEAFHRAVASPAGPVHLNVGLREPLAPVNGPLPTINERLSRWSSSGAPWRTERRPGSRPVSASAEPVGCSDDRVLVVAGSGGAESVRNAARAGVPCLVDATAWTSGEPDVVSGIVHGADLILAALSDPRLAGLRERLAPDVVVRAGGALASKRVGEFIAPAPRLIVERGAARQDERHVATAVDAAPSLPARGNGPYLELWKRVSAAAAQSVGRALEDDPTLNEPWIAREVTRAMPIGPLVVGSSMPVRDVDAFWPGAGSRATCVVANRGASGIDGTISTAVGVSSALQAPTTVLVGDLTLLHDIGGLANVAGANSPVHIVVINNDGGGIFHFLPIASAPDAAPHFERVFGTPHGFTFESAASMFDLRYERATTRAEARRALAALATAPVSMLIECVTRRSENVEAHRRLQRAVADGLVAAFEGDAR